MGARRASEPGLVAEALAVRYGKATAVRGVSLAIQPGEAVAVIGPNSAGKTSLVGAIAEQNPVRTVLGSLSFAGEPLLRLNTRQRWAAGIRLVPEGRQVFPNLTVADNLRVIADALRVPWRSALEAARTQFPEVFSERVDVLAGSLSGGEQQMVALARALVGGPRILLMDEPALGLAPRVAWQLADVLGRLVEAGMGVLVTDQGLGAWTDVVSRAHVLVRGEIVGSVSSQAEVNDLLASLLE